MFSWLYDVFAWVVNLFMQIILFCIPVKDPPIPDDFVTDKFWGRKYVDDYNPPPMDIKEIRPFRIDISDDDLEDFRTRVSLTRIQDSMDGVNFEYGMNSNTMLSILDYWKNDYHWKEVETKINSYPQFKTQIEGIDIHFIHIKSSPKSGPLLRKQPVPLMMVHGFPSSFVEFLPMIDQLVKETSIINYEIIVPSIPGYGFSEEAHKPGLNVVHVGRIFVKLMDRLGHKKFFYHGGDWGSFIGKAMAISYPSRILGYHTNMANMPINSRSIVKILFSKLCPRLVYADPDSEYKRVFPVMDRVKHLLRETGYFHIQATKPDTVGMALNQSPAGLAAYILEKWSTWTDVKYIKHPDGGLSQNKFTKEQLTTNVMIYWWAGNITSACRFYKEYFNIDGFDDYPVKVPSAVVLTKDDFPVSLMREHYPHLVQFSCVEDGGHFLALENPKWMAGNVHDFIVTVLTEKSTVDATSKKE